MRGNLGLFVSSADRVRLAAIIADLNSPHKHVWRAQVVLVTGDRVGANEIRRRTGLGKVSVWCWQERYIDEGAVGLLRDKTRPSRISELAGEKVAEVIRRTQEEAPSGGGTHHAESWGSHSPTRWTVRAMAAATGVSRAKVHVIWREAGLVSHRWRLELSNDPALAEKREDVVGPTPTPCGPQASKAASERARARRPARRSMRWCCRSTRSRRFRPWIGGNPACR